MPRLVFLILCLFFLSAWTGAAPAAELGGATLPDRLQVGDQECRLAGSGLRSKFFIKVYAAGLYLATPTADLERAVADDQPKAMLLNFIHDGISGEKLQAAWREGFTANTPAPAADLQARMTRFVALFSATAHRGDRVLLAYQPARGTTVSFNDREAATIPGRDFMQALLRIWFGPQPADSDLKKQVTKDLLANRP